MIDMRLPAFIERSPADRAGTMLFSKKAIVFSERHSIKSLEITSQNLARIGCSPLLDVGHGRLGVSIVPMSSSDDRTRFALALSAQATFRATVEFVQRFDHAAGTTRLRFHFGRVAHHRHSLAARPAVRLVLHVAAVVPDLVDGPRKGGKPARVPDAVAVGQDHANLYHATQDGAPPRPKDRGLRAGEV